LPDTMDGLKKYGINWARNSGGVLAELGEGESGQIKEPHFKLTQEQLKTVDSAIDLILPEAKRQQGISPNARVLHCI